MIINAISSASLIAQWLGKNLLLAWNKGKRDFVTDSPAKLIQNILGGYAQSSSRNELWNFGRGIPTPLKNSDIEAFKSLPRDTQLLVKTVGGHRVFILGESDHFAPPYRQLERELLEKAVEGRIVLLKESLERDSAREKEWISEKALQRDISSSLVFGLENPWVHAFDRLVVYSFVFRAYNQSGTDDGNKITRWLDTIYDFIIGLRTSPILQKYWNQLPSFDRFESVEHIFDGVNDLTQIFGELSPREQSDLLSELGGLYDPYSWFALSMILATIMLDEEGEYFGIKGDLLNIFFESVRRNPELYFEKFSGEWRTRFWLPHIRQVALSTPTSLDMWVLAGNGHLPILEKEL